MSDDMVPLENYSRALDEIYLLRQALAYEARVLEVHYIYKTFPKSRRKFAEEQHDRMQAAARGELGAFFATQSVLRRAMKEAGASETLTRSQWEAQVGLA